jgi:hypothetical protein
LTRDQALKAKADLSGNPVGLVIEKRAVHHATPRPASTAQGILISLGPILLTR